MKSINPYNDEILKEFDESSDLEINGVLDIAAKTFAQWKETSFSERAQLLKACSKLLKDRCDELSSLITLEMGKRIKESEAEIKKCAWVCDYYAEHAEAFLRSEILPVSEAQGDIVYDPIGPVLAIMPWNFPFWQVFRFAAPTVMAGNVGILKHASNVPQCSTAIEKLFNDAGFPGGAFQSLFVFSGRTGDLIEDDRIAAVTLTGSEEAGKKIAERAGRGIKKVVLELGGSDPFIILEDADIETATDVAAKARMINCGQSCISAKRFIVHEKISDLVIEKLVDHLEKLIPGNPINPATGYGPLAKHEFAELLDRQVMNSVQKGAKIILGGKRTEGFNSTYYCPTVLVSVTPGMPAFDEELFGPVAPVTIAKNDEEAIALANESRFGLGASLWTQDIEKAKRLSRNIDAGSVFINDMVASHPAVPFGGIKKSGYGRELSHLGIREFMNIKSVWIKK